MNQVKFSITCLLIIVVIFSLYAQRYPETPDLKKSQKENVNCLFSKMLKESEDTWANDNTFYPGIAEIGYGPNEVKYFKLDVDSFFIIGTKRGICYTVYRNYTYKNVSIGISHPHDVSDLFGVPDVRETPSKYIYYKNNRYITFFSKMGYSQTSF